MILFIDISQKKSIPPILNINNTHVTNNVQIQQNGMLFLKMHLEIKGTASIQQVNTTAILFKKLLVLLSENILTY